VVDGFDLEQTEPPWMRGAEHRGGEPDPRGSSTAVSFKMRRCPRPANM
jgi:hypothetical protein